ncbi:MAG: M48 family metalloprotease [Alphaproteobacteria bacterium]|nr:M48 family metalloprotease [Alphaproteobacteria bacterium]
MTRRGLMAGAAAAGLLAGSGLGWPRAQAQGRLYDALFRDLRMDSRALIRFGEELDRPLIARAGGPYPNAYVQSALDDFARPIFDASDATDLPWKVTLVDNDMPNAWVLPGGRVSVYKGLLRYVENADELALVIAHAAGHVEAGDLLAVMREPAFADSVPPRAARAILARLDRDETLTPADSEIAQALQRPVLTAITGGYGPDREARADAAAARIFARTGHDPRRGAVLFETMAGLAPPDAGAATCFFAGRDDAAARARTLASAAMPARSSWPANTGFDTIKLAFPTRRYYRPQASGDAS